MKPGCGSSATRISIGMPEPTGFAERKVQTNQTAKAKRVRVNPLDCPPVKAKFNVHGLTCT
jgi:hypothetical protein